MFPALKTYILLTWFRPTGHCGICEKIFKNGPIKICWRYLLKDSTWHDLLKGRISPIKDKRVLILKKELLSKVFNPSGIIWSINVIPYGALCTRALPCSTFVGDKRSTKTVKAT